MTRLLLFGANGQVGRELFRSLSTLGEVIAATRNGRLDNGEPCLVGDLSDPGACAALVGAIGPAAIVNAAAYTAVDKAESDRDMAFSINGDAPGALARACAVAGIPFVHYSTDYVFGFPLTYGIGNSQFKFGYAHLSSHLGDELAIRDPDALDDRVNYVRDSLVLGASHYPVPSMRFYGEAGWAFHRGGGAKPWEFQFGHEFSEPGPTGLSGSPFFAINGHIREELNYGGNLVAQIGWFWRGNSTKVLRTGFHYFNGKSNQFEFFRNFEEQLGMGLWYEF